MLSNRVWKWVKLFIVVLERWFIKYTYVVSQKAKQKIFWPHLTMFTEEPPVWQVGNGLFLLLWVELDVFEIVYVVTNIKFPVIKCCFWSLKLKKMRLCLQNTYTWRMQEVLILAMWYKCITEIFQLFCNCIKYFMVFYVPGQCSEEKM